ncbi:hypothetical protein [Streptomyces sp. NPDC054765]
MRAALPRITSPATRLLALQCALRADTRGHVRLPAGLLHSMCLRGRSEPWEELAHAHWLQLPNLRPVHMEARLLDAAVLDQAPGRRACRRAAHWALRPAPMLLPAAAPPVVRLAALALAAHSTAHVHQQADMDILARLCGHCPHQMGELLDRLVAARTLTAWHHNRETDEVRWQLPQQPARACPRPASAPSPTWASSASTTTTTRTPTRP